ncbi:hypothetical protein BUE93_20970 [Chromobacterium amazonense]|uniref:BZIP domain-containing protein n=1 Tax=Chromobacterium amazonense TaxID=1382803 RepID=A0A2S9WZ34_9NEIS|nr:hypothetical protein [Chromobacterium amazonense]PRP68737.1 hypothetical protein BUE93_20970 [Chromobacterium amazonense]
MLTITFRLCMPKVGRFQTWNGAPMTRIDAGLVRINIWRGAALEALNKAILGIMRDPEWLTLNAPAMRHARRKAIAKERAEFRRRKEQELERWVERANSLEQRLSEQQADNYALRRTIAHLTRENAT